MWEYVIINAGKAYYAFNTVTKYKRIEFKIFTFRQVPDTTNHYKTEAPAAVKYGLLVYINLS